MPTNYTIVGTGSIVWGANETAYTAIGEVIGGDDERGGEVKDLKNKYGNTWLVVLFDDRNDGSFKALMSGSATIPDRGDTIDVAGHTDVIVLGYKIDWQNDDAKAITIQWSKPDHVTIA